MGARARLTSGPGVSVCAKPLMLYVTLGKSLIPLSLSFPISFARTESHGKELKAWELERGWGSPGAQLTSHTRKASQLGQS